MIDGEGHGHEVVGEEQQHDHQRRGHERPRHDEPERQEERDLGGLDDLVQRPGHHPLVDAAAHRHGGYRVDEAGVGQHQAGRGLGDVDGVLDGDAHLGLLERRRVVDAVSGHPDHAAVALQRADELELVLREDPGDHRAPLGPRGIVSQLGAGADGRLDADLAGDGDRGGRGVTGQHLDLDAEVAQLSHQLGRVGAGPVGERHQSRQPKTPVRAGGDREDPGTRGRQPIDVGSQGRGGIVAERRDDLGHPFDDPGRRPSDLHGRLGPFRHRVERLEAEPGPRR